MPENLMPKGSWVVVTGSYHMTFLAACKPSLPLKDPELRELRMENDRRREIQSEVTERISTYLQETLR